MSQRVALITGANAGIGRETARGLARLGWRVVLAVRDTAKGEEAAADIAHTVPSAALEVARLDVASLADVRRFSRDFLATHERLDVLVNNAGIHTAARALTPDGRESTFATNHLGHFLLTRELLPLLRASAQPRVVTVASEAHRFARLDLDDLDSAKRWIGAVAYANSKLCNILFAFELARREPSVSSFAVHPGSVRTGWARGEESGLLRFAVKLASPLLISPERGALSSLYAAASPDLDGKTGLYLVRAKAAKPTRAARNPQLARQLWDISEKMVAEASS